MKLLFISTEFEEQPRGITGIIKSMAHAAKISNNEVGALVGYPNTDSNQDKILDSKVEMLYLQHYFTNGRKDLYPNLRSKKNQLSILLGREFKSSKQMTIEKNTIKSKNSLIDDLDYIIKIPYVYRFITHGYYRLVRNTLKKAIRKYKIDLVITGAPMNISRKDVYPAKLVQFVHDTMPIDLLETPADNRTPVKFARSLYAAATQSNMVLTNSNDTAFKVREINSKMNTKVLYGSINLKNKNYNNDSVLLRRGLKKGEYLLFISVLELRKNIERLIDAYGLAYEKIRMTLVIVGGNGYGYKKILDHYKDMPEQIRSNIKFLGYVNEEEKYTLLNNANSFVFPSLYEGFGLPIIEAFASNLPVLTSNVGAMPEAGGNAALYIQDPYNTVEISNGLIKIAKDDKIRKELIANIKPQIEKFTVDNFNKRFIDALNDLD
jgi:glycosyltransferase involved in cell wall biosynthesis